MKKLAFAITAASGAAAVLSHHDAEASTQHKVQSGESLWTIAQQYNTSVERIIILATIWYSQDKLLM